MIKRIIICFLLLSFAGCEPAEIEFETKHRFSVGPNDRTQVVRGIEQHTQSADVIEDPVEKPLLTDVSEDIMPEDTSDEELVSVLVAKVKEIVGKQWPIYKDTIKWWLCVGVLLLGGCILLLHWFIRFIDHLFFPHAKLCTTIIVVLLIFAGIFLIIGI